MDRAALIELASPPCHECGGPVLRVEMRWMHDAACSPPWRPVAWFMVCGLEHRVPVEPFAAE